MKFIRLSVAALMLLGAFSCVAAGATPIKTGDAAPDFTLKTLDDHSVRFSSLTSNGPVVLVVLRGWPGYQCPACTAQVRDYTLAASAFAGANAKVLMVYPGPSAELKAHAQDFLKSKEWPKDFTFVIDPDYTMVNAYGVRWDAKGETSYPSTFVVDPKGTVRFVKISHSHGDRTKAAEALAELKKLKAN